MIKAVLFDMDGVIIDSEPLHKQIEMDMLKSFGANVERRELEAMAGTPLKVFCQTMKDRYSISLPVDEMVAIKKERYFEELCAIEDIEPIEGIPELLQRLKSAGLKIALASSSPIEVIEYIISAFDIRQYFDTVVTGDYVERGKPAPDIFLYAAKQIGVNPDECVVIEDSGNGVRAAKAARMKCIAFKNLNSGHQDISPADMVIEKFDEIEVNNL